MIFSDLPASNTLALTAAISSTRISMVSYRQNWNQLQPTAPTGGITNNPADPSYNWAFFDLAIAQATKYGKQCFLRVLMQQNNTPEWVDSAAQQFVDVSGGTWTIWWDTFYQAAAIAMIQAMGAKYASNPIVKIVGFNIAATTSGDWSVPHATNGNWINTASFNIPAVNGTVNVPTGGVNAKMTMGEYCFIPSYGWYQANANSGTVHTTLLNPGTSGNASPGTAVPANTTIEVSDVLNLQGPIYNYTTARFVAAIEATVSATAAAWPNQIWNQEVGRNGTLDPFPGSQTFQYNAATQICQWGYATITTGHFAMGKNTLSAVNVYPAAAFGKQDGSDLYLPSETVFGLTNGSGTTGSIPKGGRLNMQFLWQTYDPTGQYLPYPPGGPISPPPHTYYQNGGIPYTNPIPVFQATVALANAYGAVILEVYEQDAIFLLPLIGSTSNTAEIAQFQMTGRYISPQITRI